MATQEFVVPRSIPMISERATVEVEMGRAAWKPCGNNGRSHCANRAKRRKEKRKKEKSIREERRLPASMTRTHRAHHFSSSSGSAKHCVYDCFVKCSLWEWQKVRWEWVGSGRMRQWKGGRNGEGKEMICAAYGVALVGNCELFEVGRRWCWRGAGGVRRWRVGRQEEEEEEEGDSRRGKMGEGRQQQQRNLWMWGDGSATVSILHPSNS